MARRILRMLILFVLVIAFNGSGFGRVLAASLSQGDLPPGFQEGQSEPVSRVELPSEPDLDLEPKADRTVGPGCTYATIAAAIAAANPGDRLLLAGNVVFVENLLINKNLIIEGGYDGCNSNSTVRPIIHGNMVARVMDIAAASVSLYNLEISSGNSLSEGGGIRFGSGVPGTLYMENVRVIQNTAQWGGGIWVGEGSTLVADGLWVDNNSAIVAGGGIRLFGGSLTLSNSRILNNISQGEGGGLAVSLGSGGVLTPVAALSDVVMQYNQSAGDGGGVHMLAGTLNFSNSWDLRWNHADSNGGGVAVKGTADLDFQAGGLSYLAVNTAGGKGGGIYLANNREITIHASSGYRINFNTNSAGGNGGGGYADAGGYFDIYGDVQMTSNYSAGNGGLFYLSGSRIWLDDYYTMRPQVWVNHAVNGGSIYALNSEVELDGVDMGGSNNGSYTTTGSGGSIYLEGSNLDASNCHFRNNRAALHGGAIYAKDSEVLIQTNFSVPMLVVGDRQFEPKATGCDPQTHCSAFYNNLADADDNGTGFGGAIYNESSEVVVLTSYLYDNQATRGGAIFQTDVTSSTWIENSLIHNNHVTGSNGAGIRNEGGVFNVRHVTFANNTGGAAFSSTDSLSKVTNSIAFGNYLGFFGLFSVDSTCNIDENGVVGVIPIFSPYIGGIDFRLRADSIAIDACMSGLSVDINNRLRPAGSFYDMGAYEGGYFGIYLPLISR